jgi:uncharacterized protein YbaP (TraB family)
VFSKRARIAALAALAALALTACHKPAQVHPALWQVDGPHGQRAWLFGTIHALPEPVDWHSPKLDAALAGSDRLVVEVARVDDAPAVFARLARSAPLLPLRDRIAPQLRPLLDRVLREHGLQPGDLDPLETWAAALTLQQAVAHTADVDGKNGVDRALVAGYHGRIEEFEGAAAQLAIFDRLAPDDQRALFEGVLRDAAAPATDDTAIARGWASGDLAPLAAETERGFLHDPELRAALLVNRNHAWANRIAALLERRARPFVAVGAAHLAGPQGLPALLAAQGYTVRRIQ